MLVGFATCSRWIRWTDLLRSRPLFHPWHIKFESTFTEHWCTIQINNSITNNICSCFLRPLLSMSFAWFVEACISHHVYGRIYVTTWTAPKSFIQLPANFFHLAVVSLFVVSYSLSRTINIILSIATHLVGAVSSNRNYAIPPGRHLHKTTILKQKICRDEIAIIWTCNKTMSDAFRLILTRQDIFSFS